MSNFNKLINNFGKRLLTATSASKTGKNFSMNIDGETKYGRDTNWPRERVNEEFYFYQKKIEQLKALKKKLKHGAMKLKTQAKA